MLINVRFRFQQISTRPIQKRLFLALLECLALGIWQWFHPDLPYGWLQGVFLALLLGLTYFFFPDPGDDFTAFIYVTIFSVITGTSAFISCLRQFGFLESLAYGIFAGACLYNILATVAKAHRIRNW